MGIRAAATLLGVLLAGRAAGATPHALSASDAPRADARVRAALERGDSTLDVIVGLYADAPSAGAAPKRRAEDRGARAERIAREKRVLDALPRGAASRVRLYGGFPALAARATRAGVLALASREEVAWIALDETRHALADTPQPARELIGSTAVNALGFDGAGRSIAILDTGVNPLMPELGGRAFPSAKVVGGADLADSDADPMDCGTHGSAVAAVAAGRTVGVAPGATIVALKISRNSQCGTAQDSVILSGIDWAIAHRDEFHISVINLSFGSAPFDSERHGFCDSGIPQYASAIEAASEAGILFVAAAGNEALTDAIAAPACVGRAVSVGAVYSDSLVTADWGGGSGDPFCEDRSISPDTVVCFSNSASDLSLLAPGAFWVVPDDRGVPEFFSGTSASAPAVSGVAAILEQARPDLTPPGRASLLRSAGRPVTDSRNGVRTPRVDALAAVRLPRESFAAYEGAPVDVPPGGAATAQAEVAGFTDVVASVQADVSMLEEDPRRLRLTLTGPDGTSVVLHDHSGAPEQAVNGVYGATIASARSLAPFQGRSPNGTWTLRAETDAGSTAARIQGFAVRMVPGQPPVPIPAGSAVQVLPLAGHVQGTKLFVSDARILNPSAEPRELSLYYVAQGLSGAQAVRATHTIGPGQVLALDDVIGSEFGYSESIGALTLAGDGARGLIASSRAFTPTPQGSYGQLVPASSADSAIGPGGRASAIGLSKNAGFHVNAGFAEVSGAPVTVRMEIYSSSGALLGTSTRTAPPNGTALVTDFVTERGLGRTDNFRLDFTVTSAQGRVAPFAVLVDDGTGDGVFVPARNAEAGGGDLIVAQASHATGAAGDLFRTDLQIANLGTSPETVTLSLIPRVLTGGAAAPRAYTIGAGATLELADVLAREFGVGDPSAAGIRIHGGPSARLLAGSRTYVERSGGTLGFSIPALSEKDALGEADGAAYVIQLGQGRETRTNFGFAEVAGAPAYVRVRAVSSTGHWVDSGYDVAPGASVQLPLTDLFAPGEAAPDLYLQFEVLGAGRVLPYGVAIDNASGDAIYVPAVRGVGGSSGH
jgi:hypothetical protein